MRSHRVGRTKAGARAISGACQRASVAAVESVEDLAAEAAPADDAGLAQDAQLLAGRSLGTPVGNTTTIRPRTSPLRGE
jgi:hypothetical protein